MLPLGGMQQAVIRCLSLWLVCVHQVGACLLWLCMYHMSRDLSMAISRSNQTCRIVPITCALQEVEAALQGSQGTASKQLKQLHGRCMLQLEDLVELIRAPLSDLERKVCG